MSLMEEDKMDPIKFTWGKADTFYTIHKKFMEMVGMSVVNKQNEKEPAIIFNVSGISEMEISGMGDGFIKFLEGDSNYRLADGGYNFKGMKIIPKWSFCVVYAIVYKDGSRKHLSYNFMIPRKYTYEKDAKNAIVVDENHPFVFYEGIEK